MGKLRIVIVGAGAVGGVCAAYMAQAGYDVTLVTKHEDAARLSRGEGLLITGVRGETRQVVPAVARIEELDGAFDAALVATKAYDMPDCARAVLPCLTSDAPVLGLQNGICTDELSAAVGEKRAVGVVVGFGATLLAPGRMEMTSQGEFILGWARGGSQGLETVREALSAVVPAHLTDDIFAQLYSKLIVNSCITSLGAVCGLKLGEMMRLKQARRIFMAIIREGMAVARAMGVKVPPYGGKLNYETLIAGNGFVHDVKRDVMLRVMGLKYRDLKSSSLQSLERGRRTEIAYFNGYIARKGEELSVPCPVCTRLCEMIGQIEARERRIHPESLMDKTFLNL